MRNPIKNHYVGLIVGALLLFCGILPVAFGTTCVPADTLDVLAGQKIVLHATPDSTTSYYFLWTQDPASGISPFTPTDKPDLTIYAPAYDETPGATNHYEVTVKVTNQKPVDGTCTNSKTICINVKPASCALCEGDVCAAHEPTIGCPPVFTYSGYKGTGYVYTYETLAHTGYTAKTLYSGTNSDYTLNWNDLDQPTATSTHVCTDVKFSIKDSQGTAIGTPCTKTICLNFNPTAAIGVTT